MGQVFVGRRNDPDIHRGRHFSADTLDLSLLKRAKDLCLHDQGHVPNLIQKEGPPICQLELAFLATLSGSCKGPFRVSK